MMLKSIISVLSEYYIQTILELCIKNTKAALFHVKGC